MRKLIIVAGLLLAVGACSRATTPGAVPRVPLAPRRFAVPTVVTSKTYRPLRDLLAALPLQAERRAALRARLLDYQIGRANTALARGLEGIALKSFRQALTLYDPVEVFNDRPTSNPLADLAGRLERLYSPRGDESAVLLTICVRMTLQPQRRKRLERRFFQIARWLTETEQLVHGQSRSWHRVIEALESAEKVWPSRFVLTRLRRAYIEQKIVVARAVHVSPYRHLRGAVSALFQTGFKIARMYLRVDQPREALNRLKEVSTEPNPDEELIRLLSRLVSPSAKSGDHLELARYFEKRDMPVALRICRAAQASFPSRPEVYACAGRIAASMEKNYLAMLNMERANLLAPGKRSYAELLALSYQQRLKSMIWDEKIVQAQKELARIEAFYREAEKQFKRPLSPPLSKVYISMGHGLYNAGRVDEAATAFGRSIAVEPTAGAYLQIATIQFKQAQPAKALRSLKLAEEVPSSNAGLRYYWQGRIEGLRAYCLRLKGERKQSLEADRRAVVAWRQFQALDLMPEYRAEAYIHEGRSLYALERKAEALDAFDRAIDVQPDRKETYADVIALLSTFGHLPEALDAYHRALGRKGISEYLKTYCSFWIIGLARRARLEPDPLAMRHLRGALEKSWYSELAKFMLGATSYEVLLSKAKSRAEQAELHFYQADRLLAGGQLDAARALWKKVVATKMMAFYEFDMASFNLHFGPAEVSTRSMDRQRPSKPPAKRQQDAPGVDL